MFNPAQFTVNQIELFMLAFFRVIGIIAMLPIFGSRDVPLQIKLGISFVLTIMLYPLLAAHGPVAIPTHIILFALLAIKEFLIGVIVGFVASLIFTVIQFAGHLADSQMGFAFVELVDPFTDMPVTTLGQMWTLVFTIFFLMINGHYFMLLAMEKSFTVIPIIGGQHIASDRVVWFVSGLIGNVFALSLKLAAPIFVTLMFTTMSLGIISRTVPQLNVFFVGLPLAIVLGFITAVAAFPLMGAVFKKMVDAFVTDMMTVLYLMA
ncbi:MAG: flagellar biosynthetic protein FliR [Chitinivibrionales bacterium]|nr:flagellar biosynthetic protein FliR [Chitinivibrionales bacterium]